MTLCGHRETSSKELHHFNFLVCWIQILVFKYDQHKHPYRGNRTFRRLRDWNVLWSGISTANACASRHLFPISWILENVIFHHFCVELWDTRDVWYCVRKWCSREDIPSPKGDRETKIVVCIVIYYITSFSETFLKYMASFRRTRL